MSIRHVEPGVTMNGIDLLSGMLPHQAYRPAIAADVASPSGATTLPDTQAASTGPAQVADSAGTGGLQELAASLQALRGVADTLRTQLESMLGDTSGAGSVASSVSASIQQRASIEFVTQEGDVVELSVRSRASIASSAASVQDASGSATATRTTVIASSRRSVQVHGNLNDKELAAIKDVLGQVETLADKFFGGDVQAAFAASASLHIDGTQLASMALDFSSRLRVSGVAQSSAGPVVDGAASVPATAAPPTPAALPASAVPASGGAGDTAAPAPTVAAAAPPAAVQPAVDYLGNALRQLQNVASIEMSMQAKLQLLLIAVIPAAKATAANATTMNAATKAAPGATATGSAGVAALSQLSSAAPLAA